MLREHNTSDNNLSRLPRVAIVLTGKNPKDIKDTEDSLAEQSYQDFALLQNTEMSAPAFFNKLNESYEICGLLNAGDKFDSKNSLQIIVNKLSESKFIGGIYGDVCVKQDGITQQFYFPPHDHETFPRLLGVFPVFFKQEATQENPLNESLEYLHGYSALVNISKRFVVSHVPELLFQLKHKEISIQKDLNYLKNNVS